MPKSKISYKRRQKKKTKKYWAAKRKREKKDPIVSVDAYAAGFNAQEFTLNMYQQMEVKEMINSGQIKFRGE